MSAIFQFSESNGAGEAETVPITNLNFGSVDASNLVTTTYPVTAGNASFEKYIRAKFSGSGWTQIANMKFYKKSGAYVAGETLKAAANVVFATPSSTPNADSDIPVVIGSALAIQSSAGTATITSPGYTKYVRMQIQSTVATPSGAGATKQFEFVYDET